MPATIRVPRAESESATIRRAESESATVTGAQRNARRIWPILAEAQDLKFEVLSGGKEAGIRSISTGARPRDRAGGRGVGHLEHDLIYTWVASDGRVELVRVSESSASSAAV